MCYTCRTQVCVEPVEHLDVSLLQTTISYYIMWGFTSISKLRYYEEVLLYFGLEEPRHDLEFRLTRMEYDEWGNALSCRMGLVRVTKVIEDRGDPLNMTFKDNEEYKELLWQLEHSYEEECDILPEDMSQTQFSTSSMVVDYSGLRFLLLIFMHFEGWFL